MNASFPGRGAGLPARGVDNQSPEFLQTKQDIGVVLDEACLPEVITPRETGKLMGPHLHPVGPGAL